MSLSINANCTGLYIKFLIRLYEAKEEIACCSKKEYLPFSVVNEKIGRNFSINRTEINEYLLMLNELGYISFIKFRGIRLNYVVLNRDKENIKYKIRKRSSSKLTKSKGRYKNENRRTWVE